MPIIPWSTNINFSSALLLHSCTTILLKESLNALEILRRLTKHHICLLVWPRQPRPALFWIDTSVVLDAYTSVYSGDDEGELAELYFTNTGFLLLLVSLASSLAMNLLLPPLALNLIVAGTFGLAFIASLFACRSKYTLPIAALRRAGRFIWSDTPFVNFFTLLYIATVLRGQAALRLQDYIAFRSIAVLELIFMKAKLAASDPNTQKPAYGCLDTALPNFERNSIKAFTTEQRLSVMLYKTAVGRDLGGLSGVLGPSSSTIPAMGQVLETSDKHLKIYRLSEDTTIIADCMAGTPAKNAWASFIRRAHGVFLRRMGKIRVVYVLRVRPVGGDLYMPRWHTNANLVTGVTKSWLAHNFSEELTHESAIFT
ncbi:hypothetical protein MMC30_006124 [Trapelia coarctata]|nr:hypothetical protein [Trapelia coarctata]